MASDMWIKVSYNLEKNKIKIKVKKEIKEGTVGEGKKGLRRAIAEARSATMIGRGGHVAASGGEGLGEMVVQGPAHNVAR
jgi:hypothetical protein